MLYLPLWAISAETGTTAWIHEQRAPPRYRPRSRLEGSCSGGDVNDGCRALDDEIDRNASR